jgi:hypothetical protein
VGYFQRDDWPALSGCILQGRQRDSRSDEYSILSESDIRPGMGMDFIDLEATARNSLGVGNDPEPQLKADPLLNFHGGVVGV